MPHTTTTRRPFWVSELESDGYILKLNLADPNWSKFDAVMTALRPRIRLAWGIHAIGMALLGVSQRLDWACPASFLKFYDDGYSAGQDQGRRDIVQLMVRGDTEISVVGRLIMDLGMDPKAVLEHLEKSEAAR